MSGRWWVVGTVLAVALAAGYGWGSLAADSTSSPPHNAGLCGTTIPDSLIVQRVGGLSTSNGVIEPPNVPEHVVLTDSPRIASLRNAICAAPAPQFTGSVRHCPVAYPLVYDMIFASDAGTSLLAVAEFSPTGCEGLSGLGLTPRSPNMRFQEALLVALGRPRASFDRGSPFLAM